MLFLSKLNIDLGPGYWILLKTTFHYCQKLTFSKKLFWNYFDESFTTWTYVTNFWWKFYKMNFFWKNILEKTFRGKSFREKNFSGSKIFFQTFSQKTFFQKVFFSPKPFRGNFFEKRFFFNEKFFFSPKAFREIHFQERFFENVFAKTFSQKVFYFENFFIISLRLVSRKLIPSFPCLTKTFINVFPLHI